MSNKTRNSSSSRSTKSSRSSINIKVKEEKARLAELAIEQSYLKQKTEAELIAQQCRWNGDDQISCEVESLRDRGGRSFEDYTTRRGDLMVAH